MLLLCTLAVQYIICNLVEAIVVQACLNAEALTIHMCFIPHFNRREFYRQQGVPVQFTPFSKECSTLWKSMGDDEKVKFQKLAEEDRDRYKREMSSFDKPLAKDGTRRGRRKKEPGQPKRNM